MNQHPLHTNSEPQWLQVTETGEHKVATELSAGRGGGGKGKIYTPMGEGPF